MNSFINHRFRVYTAPTAASKATVGHIKSSVRFQTAGALAVSLSLQGSPNPSG